MSHLSHIGRARPVASRLAGALLLVVPRLVAETPPTAPGKAVSISRQFHATAPGQLLPQAVCVFAERVREDWSRELDLSPGWRDPIYIRVDPQSATTATPAPLRVGRTETGLKYQIVQPSVPVDPRTLALALVEALTTEHLNRARPVVRRKPFTVVPAPTWLAAGLGQLVLGRDETLMQAARLSLAGGRPQPALDLLRAEKLPADPAERRLFQANAWLLTEGLRRRPRGTRKLQQYLVEVGQETPAVQAFWSVYAADFPDAGALERWWAVELSDRLTAVIAQNLSVAESAARLDDILDTRLTGVPTSTAFGELERSTEQPWLADVLHAKQVALLDLQARAVPVYRPIVAGYLNAVQLLAERQRRRFRRVVAATDANRTRIEAFARQISRYLDQAERVHAPHDLNQTYHNFFAVFEELEALQQHRRNPISEYLDQFDQSRVSRPHSPPPREVVPASDAVR